MLYTLNAQGVGLDPEYHVQNWRFAAQQNSFSTRYSLCIGKISMAGIDEGVVQVRADDEDEFTEGEMMYQPLTHTDPRPLSREFFIVPVHYIKIDAVEALKSKVTRKKGRGFGGKKRHERR